MPTRHTILVVDDEADVVESVQNLLRPDYNVLGAMRAGEAMEILNNEEVQVVMTDQRMPETTGVELLARIRDEHPEAINRGNVYRYITKPWDPEELRTIIRDACAHYDLIVGRKEMLRELQLMNTELKSSDRLKSSFIKVVGHEFRTPVTILVGLCQLTLRDATVTGPLREQLQRIGDAAGRLERLVNQTLKMLSAQRFDLVLVRRRENVAALLREAVEDIRPFVELREQRLSVDLADDLGVMELDADKLRDGLNHLLLNAIKFTPDRGRIGLMARREEGGLRIEVRDDGSGIAPDSLPRVFQPFFTDFDVSRHSSGDYKHGTRGLGLGLSVVKAYVEMHGGHIGVSSEIGRGSTFSLFLPAAIEAQKPVAVGI